MENLAYNVPMRKNLVNCAEGKCWSFLSLKQTDFVFDTIQTEFMVYSTLQFDYLWQMGVGGKNDNGGLLDDDLLFLSGLDSTTLRRLDLIRIRLDDQLLLLLLFVRPWLGNHLSTGNRTHFIYNNRRTFKNSIIIIDLQWIIIIIIVMINCNSEIMRQPFLLIFDSIVCHPMLKLSLIFFCMSYL